jgi:hypothetical protein
MVVQSAVGMVYCSAAHWVSRKAESTVACSGSSLGNFWAVSLVAMWVVLMAVGWVCSKAAETAVHWVGLSVWTKVEHLAELKVEHLVVQTGTM